MKEIEYIVGIYNFFNPHPDLGSESAYYLLYLLDEKGILEKESAEKLFTERFKDEGLNAEPFLGAIGPIRFCSL
jgi:hypothetical protein